MSRLFLALALLCALTSNADARHRHQAHRHRVTVADPGCNVFFPCEGVTTSVRGERIVKAMGGFGSAQKIYRRRSEVRHPPSSPGLVRASSGATAHVAASATSAFQCLVDRLEGTGYPVKFMGGWRAHGSVRGSLHPLGLALDVNQLGRNVTRPPMPANEIELARACGLISGAQWANGDSGHFQLGGWAGGNRRYASRRRARYASAP